MICMYKGHSNNRRINLEILARMIHVTIILSNIGKMNIMLMWCLAKKGSGMS
jgi:hypothetical protein